MKYIVVFTGVIGLLFAGFSAQAQEVCKRIHVYFEAAETSELDGKISVGYEQTGGGEYGFADFWLDEETVEAGDTFRVGAFSVTGVDSFRVFFNDDEMDVDGDGEFVHRLTDCGGALPGDDGRLNLTDPASLAIVYRNSKTGGFDVYLVNAATGGGDLVIRAARAEVDSARAAATAPGGLNTLIAADGPVSLWALTSGECQRNAFYLDGKPDVFIFPCGGAN